MKPNDLMKSAGILGLAVLFGALAMISIPACNKTTTPPVYDTVTVIKNDTTVKTDTLYATKPDTTVNLTRGLLLYLPFSGNIADSSGNANPTTAVGSVLTYDAHGYANNAFGSTGNGNKIYVTNNGSIKFDTAWTLSMDLMANDNREEALVDMVDPTTAQGTILGTGIIPGYGLVAGAMDISLGCGYLVYDNRSIGDTTNYVPDPGAWYNMISIYHKGSLQVYINGQLISTRTGVGTAANSCPSAQVIIGAWWDSDPQSLNGKLDNVRLYNRVLTPHEIATLAANYQVTSTTAQRTLQAH